MVDQVLALRAHGHRGRIHLLSARPVAARACGTSCTHRAPACPRETRGGHAILAALRRAAEKEGDWRGLMDG